MKGHASKALEKAAIAPLKEIGFTNARFQAAAHFFKLIGYPLPFVTICNDSTAVKPEVTWRPTDDVLIGFVVDDNLLPFTDLRAGTSKQALEVLFLRYPIATQVDTILVNPIDPRFPSFVLAIFAQKGPVQKTTHQQRWSTVIYQLQQHGLYVISNGADGDAAHMNAMLENHQPPKQVSELQRPYSVPAIPDPLTQFKVLSVRATHVNLSNGTSVWMPHLSFQDFIHVAVKIRYCLLPCSL